MMHPGRIFRSCVAALPIAITSSCGRAGDRSTNGVGATSGTSTTSTRLSNPADEERYRAELTCTAGPDTICVADTAYVHDENGDNPYPMASWVYLGFKGDSTEFATVPPGGIATNLGQDRDSLGNTSSRFRRMLRDDGVVWLDVSLGQNSSDTVPYVLRVRPAPSPSATLRWTGHTAQLNLTSPRETDRFSIIPVSIVATVTDRSKWTVPLGRHKILLVQDSLYEVCRMPCSRKETVKLVPDTMVTRSY